MYITTNRHVTVALSGPKLEHDVGATTMHGTEVFLCMSIVGIGSMLAASFSSTIGIGERQRSSFPLAMAAPGFYWPTYEALTGAAESLPVSMTGTLSRGRWGMASGWNAASKKKGM